MLAPTSTNDLSGPERLLQPPGDMGLPQSVEHDPGGDRRVASVDQHLGAPPGGDQRGVVTEVQRPIGVALRPEGGQAGLDGIEPVRDLLHAERTAGAGRNSGQQGMTTHAGHPNGPLDQPGGTVAGAVTLVRMRSARVS